MGYGWPVRPLPTLSTLLIGVALALAPSCGPTELQPVLVEEPSLDLIAAFERGEARVLAEDDARPLWAGKPELPGWDQGGVHADSDRHLLRANAEIDLEFTLGPYARGARLAARTLVCPADLSDPERVDPAPVTFRILVDGVEAASLSSD